MAARARRRGAERAVAVQRAHGRRAALFEAIDSSMGERESARSRAAPGHAPRRAQRRAARVADGDVRVAHAKLSDEDAGPKLVAIGKRGSLAASGKRLYMLAMTQMPDVDASVWEEHPRRDERGRPRRGRRPRRRRRRRRRAGDRYLEITGGCFLTVTENSQGTMFTQWSREPVPGALAYFAPGKPVPDFTYRGGGGDPSSSAACAARSSSATTRAGRSSSSSRATGTRGSCCSVARDIARHLNEDVNVTTLRSPFDGGLPPRASTSACVVLPGGRTLISNAYVYRRHSSHVDGVAATHPDADTFAVQRMDLELFINKATREGGGIAFRKAGGVARARGRVVGRADRPRRVARARARAARRARPRIARRERRTLRRVSLAGLARPRRMRPPRRALLIRRRARSAANRPPSGARAHRPSSRVGSAASLGKYWSHAILLLCTFARAMRRPETMPMAMNADHAPTGPAGCAGCAPSPS